MNSDAPAEISAASERIETPIAKGKLVWRCWGAGQPLILLHGGYGSWKHWVRNVVPLSRSRRVIAPDMPGFGESADGVDMTSPVALADELDRGLAAMLGNETSFHLAGFSFGGLIAGHLLSLAGKRVRSLTLVGSGGTGLTRPPAAAELVRWRDLQDGEAIRSAHRRNLALHMIFREDRIDDAAIAIQAENTLRARVRSRGISRAAGLRECLSGHRLPLAGIWGQEDATARGFLEERREFLREFDPDAPLSIIPDAGHWVQYEAADAFNEAFEAILSSR